MKLMHRKLNETIYEDALTYGSRKREVFSVNACTMNKTPFTMDFKLSFPPQDLTYKKEQETVY